MTTLYEDSILRVLQLHSGRINTSNLAKKAKMGKTTAIKYLEVLRERNVIDFEMIGPSKVWRLK